MDKNLYVEQITNGADVSSLILVKRSDLRSKRGVQFVYMTLADRTGTIECKAYDDKAVEAFRTVKTCMVYAICGVGRIRGPVELIPGQGTEFIITPAGMDFMGDAVAGMDSQDNYF